VRRWGPNMAHVHLVVGRLAHRGARFGDTTGTLTTELWHRTLAQNFGTPAGRVPWAAISCPSVDFSQRWCGFATRRPMTTSAATVATPGPQARLRSPKLRGTEGTTGPALHAVVPPNSRVRFRYPGGSTRPTRRSPLAQSDRERLLVYRTKNRCQDGEHSAGSTTRSSISTAQQFPSLAMHGRQGTALGKTWRLPEARWNGSVVPLLLLSF
jgi:hypothetical protein